MTAKANPSIDPFAVLVDSVKTEDKARNGSSTPAWEGPIPPSVISWVTSAVDDNLKVTIPCDNGTLASQLRSAIQTEVKTSWPGMSAYVRDVGDDDGALVAVSFTVGAARGRKAA